MTATDGVNGSLRGSALGAWLDESRGWTEERLRRALATCRPVPERFAEALEYALMGGGKRLRPALVRLVCRELGGGDEAAAAPAVAIEMVHSYSLVHDDLPCMDDDDLRRGRPTCHKVYGEGIATLVGDGLLTAAFECLARDGGERVPELVACLARAAGAAGMVGGQVLDLEGSGERADDASVTRIHELKTGALIRAACELGGIAAGAPEPVLERVRAFGADLGLLFQAVDDLLDVLGDAASLGKTPGKDAANDKATLVAVLGLEGARARAAALAASARSRVRELGVPDGSLLDELVDSLLSRTT